MDKYVIRSQNVDSASSVRSLPEKTSNRSPDGPDSTIPTKRAKITSATGRSFQNHWRDKYNWISYDDKKDKVFCSVCTEIISTNGSFGGRTKQDQDAIKAFVSVGFSTWGKALQRFQSHEQSDFHKSCCAKKMAISKGVNIQSLMSKSKENEMKSARVSLLRMISSLRYLMSQGLAIRGHTDQNSNYRRLLELVAEDNPDLASWLSRSKYRWLSHDVTNELGSIMTECISKQLIKALKDSPYYSIIIDETSDVSQHEQVSICFRFVEKCTLEIHELFFGFYKTETTTADALLKIIIDVLTRFSLEINLCRGIATDGAANMAGAFSGLQAKLKEIEPKVVHVHCLAHSLNLVTQEAMQNEAIVRDFISNIKEMINFVRGSPKRLAIFMSLQAAEDSDGKPCNPGALRPFCPTRWCCKISSLKTVWKNYKALVEFFEEVEIEKNDSGAKARGFLNFLGSFDFVFICSLLIKILESIEILNAFLQNSSLVVEKAVENINNVRNVLKASRTKENFQVLWEECLEFKEKHDIEDPKVPRVRKVPRRLDDGAQPTTFSNPNEYYRRIYFAVVDTVVSCLENRFRGESLEHCKQLEIFLLKKTSSSYIASFYNEEFNWEKLELHRNMLLDVCATKEKKIESIKDLIDFLRENNQIQDLIPEVNKLLMLYLTIPVSTCTSERSFSALRRLKTYLRNSMKQETLNNAAIMHINKHEVEKLNINEVADIFIKRSAVRKNTFSLQE